MFFLFLFYPFLELASVWQMAQFLGWVDTLLLLAFQFFLGLGLLRKHGEQALQELQKSTQLGISLDEKPLFKAMGILGSLFLLIPGFLSDLPALFLLAPGLRQLSLRLLQRILKNQARAGRIHIFHSGQSWQYGEDAERTMRDVTPPSLDGKQK